MGATQYGFVAERHPPREAEALAAELVKNLAVGPGLDTRALGSSVRGWCAVPIFRKS